MRFLFRPSRVALIALPLVAALACGGAAAPASPTAPIDAPIAPAPTSTATIAATAAPTAAATFVPIDVDKPRATDEGRCASPCVDSLRLNGGPPGEANGLQGGQTQGGFGFGSDAGVGLGSAPASSGGRLGGGSTRTKSPSLRQGATQITGALPPEVIQRIVRQNFGRFRLCYEQGLRANPDLSGRVSVTFVIDATGAVSKASDAGSTLTDKAVVTCVVRGFGNLSFPKPENGSVTVVYPITFDPGS